MATPFATRITNYVNAQLAQVIPQLTAVSNYYNQTSQSAAGTIVSIDTTRQSAMVATPTGGPPTEFFLQNRWVQVGDAVAAIGGRIL